MERWRANESGRWHRVCPGRSVRDMDGMHEGQLLVFSGLMLVLIVAMTIVC